MDYLNRLTHELFSKYKIVPIVISFITGILINTYSGSPWVLAAGLGIITVIVSIFFRNLSFLLFIPLGLIFSADSQLVTSNNITNYIEQKVDLEGVLYKSPDIRESGSRFYLQTQNIFIDGKKESVSGKVIIYSTGNNQFLVYGDRIRFLDIELIPIENFKNPGGFDLKGFYERQGIYARGFVEGEDSILSFGLEKSYNPVLHYIDLLRIKFGSYVRANFPSPQAEILNAITIGDKAGIPQEVRTEYSRAGVAHILAISGLHVGSVAITFFFLIKWLLKRSEYLLLQFQVPRLAAAMTILPIFLYTAVAGFSTSTVRAFIMITLYLISIVIGKEQYRVNTFSAAALIILIWHPWSLFELSFQLSFAAVFAILIAHRFYPFKFNTIEDKFYSLLKTTIAATLATFPLVANSFGVLPLVSIPSNVVLVPVVEFIIVPLSLLSFIGFVISAQIAEPIISLNIFFIEMFSFGVDTVLKIPYSSLTIPTMNTVSWAMLFVLLISLIAYSRYPRIKFIIPLFVIGLILSLIIPYPFKASDGELEISFLDTGKKKSLVLVELPNSNSNIVIASGYPKSSKNGYIEKTVFTKYLLSQGVNKIDALILSSTDPDTLEGASHLIKKFNVKRLYTNGDKLSGELWELINDEDVKLDNLSNTEVLRFEDVDFQVLRPETNFLIEDSSMPDPIGFRISYNKDLFLIGRSLNQPQFQKELIYLYGRDLKSTALYIPNLKVDESFIEFVDYVSPKILITGNSQISSNSFGGIIILESDKDGAIKVSSDGGELKIKSFTTEKDLVLH